MTALWIVAGIALGVAALAALLLAAATLVRAVATLLPPAGQLLVEVQQLREWQARKVEDQARRQMAGQAKAPVERSSTTGIAPEPVFEAPPAAAPRRLEDLGPTSASIPVMPVGDLDRWEALTLVEEPITARPLAPESKISARPPGPPVEGEEDYGRRTD